MSMVSSEESGSKSTQESSLLAALERIGFLEWRLEQLGAELTTERAKLHEHRSELARSSRREAETAETIRDLRMQLAQTQEECTLLSRRYLEAEATRNKLEQNGGQASIAQLATDYARLLARAKAADRQEEELAHANERISRLQAQLNRFFERLIQWQHATASDDPDAIDLIELISDLRGETLRLEAANAAQRRHANALAEALANAEIQQPSELNPYDEDSLNTHVRVLDSESSQPPFRTSIPSCHNEAAVKVAKERWESGTASEGALASTYPPESLAQENEQAMMTSETNEVPIRLADALFALSCSDVDQKGAKKLLESLMSEQPVAIRAELLELRGITGRLAPTLLGAVVFEASTFEARLAAVRALADIGGPVTSLVLNHCLDAQDWRLRAAGAEGLLSAPILPLPDAQRAFHRALADCDPKVRRRAAVAAAGSSACTEEILMVYLFDKDAQTRRALAVAVGERGGIKGLFALSRLLHDPDLQVRRTAARALERRLSLRLPSHLDNSEKDRRIAARAIRERLIEQYQSCSR
ncbi:MAG: hypothetical protein KTR25_18680 [Myxococcales bacterium]|nr:hypothetical protein [Myxococcales bacterium]